MREQPETTTHPRTTCASCGAAPAEQAADAVPAVSAAPGYVYALGRIEARFPNLAIEKEFAQATGRAETAGKTDEQAFHTVLARPENRYLARQLCWVLTVQGLDTYLLVPRDPADLTLLIEAVRLAPNPNDLDVVIGTRGNIAPPAMCNGLMVPIVTLDQVYSFDRESLLRAIPKPEKAAAAQFASAADALFTRILQMTDNAGARPEDRALNYLAMRYPAIYATAAEQFAQDFSLTGVETRPSALSGVRRIVDVVFAYSSRKTDFAEKFFVRVDVTEEFPFLVSRLSPYYDR